AFIFENGFQGAICRSNNFQNHFIGFNVDQQFVTLYRLTRLFVPGSYRAISDRFRKCGCLNFDAHQIFLIGFLQLPGSVTPERPGLIVLAVQGAASYGRAPERPRPYDRRIPDAEVDSAAAEQDAYDANWCTRRLYS